MGRSIHTGYIELETKSFDRFDINKLLFFVYLFLLAWNMWVCNGQCYAIQPGGQPVSHFAGGQNNFLILSDAIMVKNTQSQRF